MGAVEEALCANWSRRRARLNRALTSLVLALASHGDFLSGGRVALTVDSLAEQLRCHPRTVTRAIGKLEQLPELVRVLRVERGELSYDGRAARVGHLEWELGDEARKLVERLTAERSSPRHGAPKHPDTVPADQPLGSGSNSRIRRAESEPNHESPDRAAAPVFDGVLFSDDRLRPAGTQRDDGLQPLSADRERPAPLERRELAPLATPRDELVAIVEAHRITAQPDRIGKPIHPEELRTVDEALQRAALPPAERVERARQVSLLALRDARSKAQGQPVRVTLRYAFGKTQIADWFLDRLARLREQRETAKRHQNDEALAAGLGLSAKPLAKARPRPVAFDSHRMRVTTPTRVVPPSEVDHYLAGLAAAVG